MSRYAGMALAIYYAITGLWLLVAPFGFYDTVPGVAMTGPVNRHFQRDIGLAFGASAAVLGWGAARRQADLVLAGIAFPLGHAALHLAELGAHGPGPATPSDLAGVVLPAGIGLALGLAMIRNPGRMSA